MRGGGDDALKTAAQRDGVNMAMICRLCKTEYEDVDQRCLCGMNSLGGVRDYAVLGDIKCGMYAFLIWVRFATSRVVITAAKRFSNWVLSPFWKPTWGEKETKPDAGAPFLRRNKWIK